MRHLLTLLTIFLLLVGCTPVVPDRSAERSPRSPGPGSPTRTATPVPENQAAFLMAARLGRGVNLGDALEAPAEGEWGVTLQEEYFDLIREVGFDSVRLPVRWSTHAGKAAPYTIDPAFLGRVDQVIGWALDRGLAVVLDSHHYISPTSALNDELVRFLAIWDQLARHYADHPPELVFEILNEPDDSLSAGKWNDIALQALAVIRASNPDRSVVIGGIYWNAYDRVQDLDLPDGDQQLIATFHYYLPFEFTHQGADWVDGMDAYLGTPWDGTPAEQDEIIRNFDLVSAWAQAHDRPVYLGEFGAYSRADMEARIRWTAFVREQAEARGFSWAYWEFCSGFGFYDPENHSWRDGLLNALIP